MRKPQLPTILLTILSIFIFGLFFSPSHVTAACDPTKAGLAIGDCLDLGTGKTVKEVYTNPAVLINILTSNIFIAGGIILLVMIIYSGFLFITGGAKGMEQAKGVLTTAILGFLIMFSAYWILRIIKIITGANILF